MAFFRAVRRGRSISTYLSDKGTDALPDLESIITRLRNNELNISEKEQLFLSYLRLAIFIVSQYASQEPNRIHDMVSEAMLGLQLSIIKAPEQMTDNNFTNYCSAKIHSRVRRWIEIDHLFKMPVRTYNHKRAKNIEIHEPIILSINDLETKVGKTREIPVRKTRLKEIREMLEASVKTEIEKKIIDLRECGYKDSEIAIKLGCSIVKVFRIRKLVEKRFKKLERA